MKVMLNSDNIFKRYEIKYLLTKEQYKVLMNRLKPYVVPDEYGESTNLSLYYDTPDKLLIRRSIEKPEYKEKLRVRSYGVVKEDGKVYVELKKKYQGIVYKRRISMKNSEAMDYLSRKKASPKKGQIADELDYFLEFYNSIEPSMLLSYDRIAFCGIHDKSIRITFDRNILYRDYDLSLKKGIYGIPVLPKDMYLMELKIPNGMPMWLTNILSEEKIYKTSFSKYGTAYKMKFEKDRERMKYCG